MSTQVADPELRPVLVTGATGFLGGHVARALLARGVPVRASGRNLARGAALDAAGADFRPVELEDRAAALELCRGVRAVIHCGARATPWGRDAEFHAANVEGTQHLLDASIAHGVGRFVHISSSSVTNQMKSQLDVDESTPYPPQHVSVYSASKRAAEERVRAASKRGLEVVILRPRAIYGPGDEVLLPRLLRVAKKGRLPRIGDGENLANMVYVDDVVDAALLALDAPNAVGNTYIITHDERVRLWDMLGDVLDGLDLPRPRLAVSAGTAMAAANALTAAWKALPLPGEPPVTPYTVSLLAWSQTFRIDAARRDLGFEPKVDSANGVARVVEHLRSRAPAPAAPPRARVAGVERSVRAELFEAGATHTVAKAFFPERGLEPLRVPSRVAYLEHATEGVVLFDTGYSTRFLAAGGVGAAAYRRITPVEVRPEQQAVEQLRARGIAADDVRWIVLSHFDPDHYGGLRDFPRARIVVAASAWEAARRRPGLALRGIRLIPELIPEDLSARLKLLPPIPAGDHFDLFGDGAIRIIELPGHSQGQIGAFVRTGHGREMLLAADACWTTHAIDSGRHGVHRWLAVDRGAQDATYRWLQRVRAQQPDLYIVPTHCPELGAMPAPRCGSECTRAH